MTTPHSLTDTCCKAQGQVIPFHAIMRLDTTQIEHLRVTLFLVDGSVVSAEGTEAIEIILQLKPSALEGRRMAWAKRAWMVHNLVGHPLMQLLALLGKPRWGIWVHDHTVPRPKGARSTSKAA